MPIPNLHFETAETFLEKNKRRFFMHSENTINFISVTKGLLCSDDIFNGLYLIYGSLFSGPIQSFSFIIFL